MKTYGLYLYRRGGKGFRTSREFFTRMAAYIGECFLDRECTVRATLNNI